MNSGLDLRGIVPPMVTLFDEKGSIDRAGNARLIDFLIEKGVNGIFVLGTMGEFTHLSLEEKKEFIELAGEKVQKRIPLLVGTGSTSTKEVIDLATCAQEKNADAVVVVNPYYEVLTENEIYTHFKTVAQEVSIPIFLYNLPSHTGQNLDVSTVVRLAAECENIVGIKQSVLTFDEVRDTLFQVRKIRKDFLVFTGIPYLLLNTLLLGGDGLVPGEANFVPEIFTSMWEAYNRNEWGKMLENFRSILNVNGICGFYSSLPGLIKEALRMRGFSTLPTVRQPSLPPSEEDRAKLKSFLEEIGVMEVWG